MSERGRNIIVGVTALFGLGGLGALLLLFGYVPPWLEKGYTIKVQMAHAGGLTEGSRVRLSGIDVGRVTDVSLQTPASKGVLVTLLIRDEFRIPSGVKARVESAIIGGSPTLALDISQLKPDVEHPSLATDGSARIEGQTYSLTSQLAEQLKGALAGPNAKLNRLVDSFETLSKEWTSVGQHINALTEPRSPQDVDRGNVQGNLTTVIARADSRLKEMRTAIDGISEWVNDKDLRDNVRTAVANVKEISEQVKLATADARKLADKLNTNIDKVGSFVDSARGDVDRLTKRYVAVADDLSGSIMEVKKTLELARQGDGTVGKLLNDPALYNNLNDAVKHLDSALTEARLLIQKWEKEGILKF